MNRLARNKRSKENLNRCSQCKRKILLQRSLSIRKCTTNSELGASKYISENLCHLNENSDYSDRSTVNMR